MTPRVHSRIGSDQHLKGRVIEVRNPSRIDTVVAEAVLADASVVDRTVEVARRGLSIWGNVPLMERSRILFAVSQRIIAEQRAIAEAMALEQGKVLPDAISEVQRASDMFAYFAGEVLRMHGEHYPSVRPQTEIEVVREPVGVVAAITPWNFPVAIPATKCAAALGYGNSVILKPSEVTPMSTSLFAACVIEAGVPPEAFSFLLGDGALGAALVAHKDIDAISFTGSVATGRLIRRAAAATEAALQLEMGGKNAWIVLDDANPALAARLAAESAFLGTGQRCTASSIVLVTPGVRAAFLAHLREQLNLFPAGDPFDPAVRIGPLANAAQLEKVRGYIASAQTAGCTAFTGPLPSGGPNSYFQPPVLFESVDPDSPIATEEIFGPVLATIDVADLDEAIAIANRTPFGLSAGICTRSLVAAQTFKSKIQAGIVTINLPTAGSEPHVPFGGVKASSYGAREISAHAGAFFTRTRTIYISTASE